MKLDEEYTKAILAKFETADSVYIPVILIAKQLRDEGLKDEDIGEYEKYAISEKLVFHLLHLQDLECIENMHGEFNWGYMATGKNNDPKKIIDESLENNEFNTPHCYKAQDFESVIRLTATGMELREALNNKDISMRAKEIVLNVGKTALISLAQSTMAAALKYPK